MWCPPGRSDGGARTDVANGLCKPCPALRQRRRARVCRDRSRPAPDGPTDLAGGRSDHGDRALPRHGGGRNETREQSTPAERRTHHECVPPDREQAVARERRTRGAAFHFDRACRDGSPILARRVQAASAATGTATFHRTMQRPAGGTQSADSVEQGGRNGPGTGSIRFGHVKRDPQVSVNLSVVNGRPKERHSGQDVDHNM